VAQPILHPTDFSEASEPAFRKAVDLARRLQAPLLIAHVVSPPALPVSEAYVAPQVYADIEQAMRADAQQRLQELVQTARAGGVRAEGLLLDGTSFEQIVEAARSRRAEMIVMGTHGRTGLKGLVMGSVTWRVLTAAPIPVLAVRAG
jgi:nucleotide-binding universal stress UspA family protein